MADEKWWRFWIYGSAATYGFGSEAEAQEYLNYLNAKSKPEHNMVIVTDDEWTETRFIDSTVKLIAL